MHFLQAINSDISVLIVCNKTGGTIKGDIKKIQAKCQLTAPADFPASKESPPPLGCGDGRAPDRIRTFCKREKFLQNHDSSVFKQVACPLCLFVFGATPPSHPPVGQGLFIQEVPRSQTTTNHTQQDSSGRVISSSKRLLPDNTQQSQQTNIHAHGGIRTPQSQQATGHRPTPQKARPLKPAAYSLYRGKQSTYCFLMVFYTLQFNYTV